MAQSTRTIKGKRKSASPKKTAPSKKPVRREIGALICFFLAVFGILGFFRIDAIFINFFRMLLGGLVGWGYYAFPVMLLAAAWVLATHRGRAVRMRLTCALLAPVSLGALLFMLFNKADYAWTWKLFGALWNAGKVPGNAGVITGIFGMAFPVVFSKIGAIIVFVVLTLFLVFVTFNLSLSTLRYIFRRRERPQYEPEIIPEKFKSESELPKEGRRRKIIDLPVDGPVPPRSGGPSANGAAPAPGAALKPDSSSPIPFVFGDPVSIEKKTASAAELLQSAAAANNSPAPSAPFRPQQVHDAPPVTPPAVTGTGTNPAGPASAEVEKAAEEVRRKIESEPAAHPAYIHPPIELLGLAAPGSIVDGSEELRVNAQRLSDTIKSFGIEARIKSFTRGPSVTRYEVELEQGVKLQKLTGLSNDLALALGAVSVRIAPIPNKISIVGIEVPNKLVSTVYLREIIASREFCAHKSKLAFAIGKDIAGASIVGDIARLPHLLIAGTTGSGKSVCMNSLIISLLYNASPDDVRLIMIDPKMIELANYNGIPHLLIPVVTDPKKAAGALQWAVNEMMKRYRLFAEVGAKDLDSYNEHAAHDPNRKRLYRIVIVVDELADLMLIAAKEVEEYICRIAQMARAAGMHLIIATQRPSANIITGIMKANIPSRISFAVASQMESRIILDTAGAEKLVGKGDMLYYPLGAGKPTRIQGTMVFSDEVDAVVQFIKNNATPDYSDEILEHIESHGQEKAGADSGGSDAQNPPDDGDELLPAAIEVVVETGQASVSMLQRRLKLGYSRAARLVDQMEARGIVGPFEGSKPRQLLISKAQWQEMQLGAGAAGAVNYSLPAYQEENEDAEE